MQITRRQFSIAVVFGILSVALARILGPVLKLISGGPKISDLREGHPARYWRRADHLGG